MLWTYRGRNKDAWLSCFVADSYMELKYNVNMDEEVLVDPEQQRIFYGFVREFVVSTRVE